MTKAERPARLYIPIEVKRVAALRQGGVCPCGCGTPCWADAGSAYPRKALVQWDHHPALILRDLTPDKTAYVPDQIDPAHIVGRCKDSHRRKTSGAGATTAGSDIGIHKKERKRSKPPKLKKRLLGRKMVKSQVPWAKGRKLQGKPFQKRRKP